MISIRPFFAKIAKIAKIAEIERQTSVRRDTNSSRRRLLPPALSRA